MALQDYYNTGDDSQSAIYGTQWIGQIFTANQTYNISSVKIKLYKGGTPTFNVIVAIRATSGGKPTGSDLTSGGSIDSSTLASSPGSFYEATFDSEIELTGSTEYAIVAYAEGGAGSYPAAHVMWRADASSPTYSNGTLVTSTDSGSSWSIVSAADNMFETYDSEENADVSGTIAGISSISGEAYIPFNWNLSEYQITKRLIALGNNEFWYEDI